jgi:hypothetical protein
MIRVSLFFRVLMNESIMNRWRFRSQQRPESWLKLSRAALGVSDMPIHFKITLRKTILLSVKKPSFRSEVYFKEKSLVSDLKLYFQISFKVSAVEPYQHTRLNLTTIPDLAALPRLSTV